MKTALREVRDAPDRAAAHAALAVFAEKCETTYPKAVECLTKDQDAPLTLLDFPAEHWDHLRTANPIESGFATVRLIGPVHFDLRNDGAKGAVLLEPSTVEFEPVAWDDEFDGPP
jgi:transposase-like protein